jgi:cytochrome o ubiquinol oxidase subunit 3
MSTTAFDARRGPTNDPYRLGHRAPGGYGHGGGHGRGHDEPTGHGEGGPASKRIIVGYGFWIFLLTDIVMFSGFFAAYAVLAHANAGGPTGPQIFGHGRAAIETAALLASSYACGLAAIATNMRSMLWSQTLLLITGLLGAVFLLIEVQEFIELASHGAPPQRSAFLSAFFTLVGCHGLHVTAGLLWLGTMMAQLWAKGFRPHVLRRLMCFNLFWHALDIIWIAIFSVVYLIGGPA